MDSPEPQVSNTEPVPIPAGNAMGRIEGWGLGVLFAIFVFCSIRPMYGIDVYWHIAVGDWIRSAGALPDRDLFSAFTPDGAWRSFQWGYQVLVSALDDLGGLSLVRWFHIALHALALALFIRLARIQRKGTAALLVGVFLIAYMDRLRVRPHVFNLLGMVGLCWWFVRVQGWRATATSAGRPWHDGWRHIDLPLVGLATLWANLHAGGAAVLVPIPIFLFTLGVLIQSPRTSWPLIRAGLFTALFMALSPGFLPGILHAMETHNPATLAMVPEWAPSWVYLTDSMADRFVLLAWAQGLLPWVALILIILAGIRQRALPEALVAGFLTYLAIRHARFLYLVAFIPLFLPLWPETWPRTSITRSAIWALTAFLGLAFAHHFLWVTRDGPMDHMDHMSINIEPGLFPEQAAHFLADAELEGRVLNQTGWGGYLLYTSRGPTGSRLRVAVDGRHNIDAKTARYIDLSNDTAPTVGNRKVLQHDFIRASLESYPVDLLLLANPVFRHTIHNRTVFVMVHRDPRAEVYLVRNEQTDENLRRIVQYYRSLGATVPDPTTQLCEFERMVWSRNASADSANLTKLATRLEQLRGGGKMSIENKVTSMRLVEKLHTEGHLAQARQLNDLLLQSIATGHRLHLALSVHRAALGVRLCEPTEQTQDRIEQIKEKVAAMMAKNRAKPSSAFLPEEGRLFESIKAHYTATGRL